MSKSYWQPHFVITTVEHNGVKYYKSGICEVYYDKHDKIKGWTANHQEVSFADEDLDCALRESYGMMVIYNRALSNTVYIEKFDKKGNPYLKKHKRSFFD